MNKYLQLPNLLTLIRLIISPLALPLLLYYLLPAYNFGINIALAILFLLFNLTDFFDGYLARKLKQESKIGRLLDPIADKFLLFSSLIALVGAGKLYFYWAIIFIARDFFMMALRIVSLEHGFSMEVTYLAKVKTAILTAYVTAVILNPHRSIFSYSWFNIVEISLLLLSLALSLWTAVEYFKMFVERYTLDGETWQN